MSSIFVIATVIIFSLLGYFQYMISESEHKRVREEQIREAQRNAELLRLRERAARRRAEQHTK